MSGNHQNPIISTGRGGLGNIGRDPHVYADGGIVREGFQGESPEGDYSSGRGGMGNMVPSPRLDPSKTRRRGSQDVIPEQALVDHKGHENYHIGRGGQGNVRREDEEGHKRHSSVIDKTKQFVEEHVHKHEENKDQDETKKKSEET